MRLSQVEQSVIKKAVMSVDPLARVFVFGSRVNEKARGGDIDLLIESKKIDFAEKRQIRLKIQEHIGEQKIDIVVVPDRQLSNDPFVISILNEAQEL